MKVVLVTFIDSEVIKRDVNENTCVVSISAAYFILKMHSNLGQLGR